MRSRFTVVALPHTYQSLLRTLVPIIPTTQEEARQIFPYPGMIPPIPLRCLAFPTLPSVNGTTCQVALKALSRCSSLNQNCASSSLKPTDHGILNLV